MAHQTLGAPKRNSGSGQIARRPESRSSFRSELLFRKPKVLGSVCVPFRVLSGIQLVWLELSKERAWAIWIWLVVALLCRPRGFEVGPAVFGTR